MLLYSQKHYQLGAKGIVLFSDITSRFALFRCSHEAMTLPYTTPYLTI